jgi:tetratricopeptide (TPR) repeat protein
LLSAKINYEAGGSKGFRLEEAVEGEDVVMGRLSDRHLIFYSISSYMSDVTLLSHPFVIISICLSPLLLKYFLRRKTARYLFGALVIPLVLLYNPWTATLIGSFITATQLWRLSWSFPIALILAYVFYQYMHSYLDNYRKNNYIQGLSTSQSAAIKSRAYLSSNFVSIVPSLAIILLTILMVPRIREGVAFIQNRKIYYVVPESEIQVGEFLKFNDGTKKNTLTDEITSRTLVGASSDLNMIRYRAQWPYDPELDKQMDYLFRQASILDAQIIKFLDDYDVEYLILKNGIRISGYLESTPSIAKLVFDNIDFKVFQITPDLKLSSTILGDISKINNDYENAYGYYTNALENDPNNPFALLGMGRIYIEQVNRQSAIRNYQKALTQLSVDEQILQIISDDLGVEDIYTLNYVNKGEFYQGPSPANETYNFIDHLEDASKSSTNNESLIRQNVFIFNKKPLGILFQHAPSSVSFDLEIPTRAWIQFSPVIAPEVWQFGKGDGVLYKIELETRDKAKYLIYEDYLDPKNVVSQRELITKSINLVRWSGESAKIIFTTGCGPNDDCRFDWSGWGEPRILQPVAYNFLDHFSEVRTDTLGTETGQAEILSQSINNEERTVLYQHPSSHVVYSIDLPSSASIQFGLGMSPEVWEAEKSDGVEYNLYVRSLNDPNKLHKVFQRFVDPKNNPDDRLWFDDRVDLSEFGGQAVEIIFEALPGPAGNYDFDWGGWSTPVLIDNSPTDADD